MGLFRLTCLSNKKTTKCNFTFAEAPITFSNSPLAKSLAELKAKISEVEGSEDVLLYVGGKPLDYETPVSSIAEFHVDVTVPLLGGKVHGSLARAGKVRGQTPKVDPQEKKKKKTGRAKRRIQ